MSLNYTMVPPHKDDAEDKAAVARAKAEREEKWGRLVYIECGCGRRFAAAELPAKCCGRTLVDAAREDRDFFEARGES